MTAHEAAAVHGTAFLVGDRGVLVFGESGAGKSALARDVISSARGAGLFAALVADDRVLLEVADGRLIAAAPRRLAGGIEVRGAGLCAVAAEPSAVVHLVVRLVEKRAAVRFPGADTEAVEGVRLPVIHVPCGQADAARRAVMARLFETPWS